MPVLSPLVQDADRRGESDGAPFRAPLSTSQRIRRQFAQLSTFYVLALYVLFALLITWPLVLQFDRVVIGDLESDVWKHLWGFWWMRECIVERHVLPLYTWLLNYPYGGSLFFIDPLGGLLSIPLQSFMTPAEAYNSLVLFNIVLACFGAFLLAKYFCKSLPAAMVAGVIYGCSPYLLSNVTSGISESFNIGWIPLFMLWYTRALREPGNSHPVVAGLMLGVATIGCWYYGAFCVVYAVFFFVYATLSRLRAWKPNARTEGSARVGSRFLSRVRPARAIMAVVLAFVFLDATRTMFHAEAYGVSFWVPMRTAGLALLALMVVLRFARRPEDPPPPNYVLFLRFAAQSCVIFSAWVFLLVVRFWFDAGWTGYERLAAPAVFSLVVLVLSLRLWQRHADPALHARLDLVRSVLERALIVAASMVLLGASAYLASLPRSDDLRLEPLGLVGSGWLLLILVLYRQRDGLGGLQMPAVRWRSWLRPLLSCAAIALVLLYARGPARQGALQPLFLCCALTAALVLVLYVRDVLVGAMAGCNRVLEEAAQRTGASDALHFGRDFYQTIFKRTLVVALVSGMVILPVAFAFKRTLNSELSIVFRVRNADNVDLHLSEQFHNISRIADYLTPGKAAAVRTYTVDRLTRASYAGYLVLLLVGVAVFRVRRRYVWWWSAVAITAVTFSLGPFLYVTSDIHLTGKFPPYMWMYNWFPFFSQVSIPFRFNCVAMLAFGVLASYTLARWMRGRTLAWQGLLSLAFSLAILLEVMYVSSAPFPVPLSSVKATQVFQALSSEPEQCGLLDLPVQRFEGELLPGEYFYYQMLHGKSIPNRVEGEIPIYVFLNRFMLQLFHLEHDWPGYPNDTEQALREGLKELRDFKFKYFVVHDNMLRPGAAGRVHGMLRHFLGKPRLSDGDISVYEVY